MANVTTDFHSLLLEENTIKIKFHVLITHSVHVFSTLFKKRKASGRTQMVRFFSVCRPTNKLTSSEGKRRQRKLLANAKLLMFAIKL